MTKLVALRITVAVDDAVSTGDVKGVLQVTINALPAQRVGENGEGGRIHWSTAEVLQGPDRIPKAKNRRGSTTGQPAGQESLMP